MSAAAHTKSALEATCDTPPDEEELETLAILRGLSAHDVGRCDDVFEHGMSSFRYMRLRAALRDSRHGKPALRLLERGGRLVDDVCVCSRLFSYFGGASLERAIRADDGERVREFLALDARQEEVGRTLLSAGGCMPCHGPQGFVSWTPLHLAAACGSVEALQLMLGAPLLRGLAGARDALGRTPLTLAAAWARPDAVALLCQHPAVGGGAADRLGLVPLCYALMRPRGEGRAAAERSEACALLLASQPGAATWRRTSMGESLLWIAVERSSAHVVRRLLDAGADPDARILAFYAGDAGDAARAGGARQLRSCTPTTRALELAAGAADADSLAKAELLVEASQGEKQAGGLWRSPLEIAMPAPRLRGLAHRMLARGDASSVPPPRLPPPGHPLHPFGGVRQGGGDARSWARARFGLSDAPGTAERSFPPKVFSAQFDPDVPRPSGLLGRVGRVYRKA